jgi:multidrug efflux pump subunit AcrB
LVTTLARHLLPDSHEENSGNSPWARFLHGFERRFAHLQELYHRALTAFIAHRALALACVALMVIGSVPLLFVVGQDFFPTVDAGMMRLHIRAPTGTRIEKTEWTVDNIERAIHQIIPANELEGISDNLGVPISYDLAYYQTDSIGPQDADILIQLKPDHHPTASYQSRIRELLQRQFPNVQSYFQAADIVSQDAPGARDNRYQNRRAARSPGV